MSTRLYLSNLPLDADRDTIADYLARFGSVSELKLIATATYVYGFAQFSHAADAKTVLDTFKGRLFMGHDTLIEPARPLRKDMEQQRDVSEPPRYHHRRNHRAALIIENLPPFLRWQELKDFSRLAGGLVAYCDVEKNGRGFIEYHTQADAEQSLQMLDGQLLGGHVVRLFFPSDPAAAPSRSHLQHPTSSSVNARKRYHPYSGASVPQRRISSDSRYSSGSGSSSSLAHTYQPDEYDPAHSFTLFSRAAQTYHVRVANRVAAPSPLYATQETILNHDYDYDGYLRQSYNQRLQEFHGCRDQVLLP